MQKVLSTMALCLALLATNAAGAVKTTIQQLTSIFENSTPVFQYTYAANIGDGRGWTFGFVGFTSGTYSGTMFLEEYRRARPSNALVRFIPAFKRIDAAPHDSAGRNPDTAGLEEFPAAFQSCGSDPRFRSAQRKLNDRLSWNPARRLAMRIGARLPITRGQLYDAYVNHGESGILDLIRRTNFRAGGMPGDVPEKKWLATFLTVRLAILKRDPTWARAVDRIAVYRKLLQKGNVRLRLPINVNCYGNSFTLVGASPGP
ncbi:MAG: chitosanase [Chthoniobacterales bacterium]